MKPNLKTIIPLALIVLPMLTLAAEFSLPPGRPITSPKVKEFITDVANFLIAIGVVGAVITIVAAGIMYFTSGFNAAGVTKGKELLKNGLIGTFIILAVGVIINTVSAIISGQFFTGP